MQGFQISYPNPGVVVCQVSRWDDWSQLLSTLNQYNRLAQQCDQSPYLVYSFEDGVTMPQPWAIRNLRKFIDANGAQAHCTIMVNAPRTLKVFTRMVQQVYANVWDNMEDYVFVDTMEEATKLITRAGDSQVGRATCCVK